MHDHLALQANVNSSAQSGTIIGMGPPPAKIKYGDVVRYALVTADCEPTGNTRRFIDGSPLFLPAAIAIVHYAMSQGGVYLFYCDASWRVLKDNWHYSTGEAMERADYEIRGLRWLVP
jgi:hypothetical protein